MKRGVVGKMLFLNPASLYIIAGNMSWKKVVKRLAGKFGYEIIHRRIMGSNAFDDMATFIRGDRPVVFDVGANIGQSVLAIRKAFHEPRIHSFEPSPTTFETLRANTSGIPDLHLWNRGIGSSRGQLTLEENDQPAMSSFLPLSNLGWGNVIRRSSVDVDTIDDFCLREGIERIDILKSDTQGYDLEVFKGAEGMIKQCRIGMIYSEIIFNDMYKNLPSFSDFYDFLIRRDFLLVSFYELAFQERLASWTDVLFVHRSLISTSAHSTPGH